MLLKKFESGVKSPLFLFYLSNSLELLENKIKTRLYRREGVYLGRPQLGAPNKIKNAPSGHFYFILVGAAGFEPTLTESEFFHNKRP
ncbi:MAG: hypothetical protein R8M71_00680 [Alphaproteobacteria bacterium]|nr:hypothetical protein [Alphaproteobacteria bacterium]